MHPAAARVVRQALAAGGKIDPVEHFDDLVKLDRLAREQECPSLAERLHLLDQPVYVGEMPLYRLSWAAWEWVEQAWGWFGDEPVAELVVPFAMAQARSKAALAAVADERAARRAIQGWARTLDCSLEALITACKELLPKAASEPGKTSKKKDQNEGTGYGPLLTRLVQECGQTFEYWMFEVSFETVNAVVNSLSAQDNAARRAAKKPGPADPRSWQSRNFNAFRVFSKAFSEKVTGG
jgi:hypothetical protein